VFDCSDPIEWFLTIFAIFGGLLLLFVLVMLVLTLGESMTWWEFNLVSDCNDYNYTCSPQ
jgi:hypothetical protein